MSVTLVVAGVLVLNTSSARADCKELSVLTWEGYADDIWIKKVIAKSKPLFVAQRCKDAAINIDIGTIGQQLTYKSQQFKCLCIFNLTYLVNLILF